MTKIIFVPVLLLLVIFGFRFFVFVDNQPVIINRLQYSDGVNYGFSYEKNTEGVGLFLNHSCVEVMFSFGDSMLPCVKYHNIVLVDTCFPHNKLLVGDVIIFKNSENDVVSHRITNINNVTGYIVTKGDNNLLSDKSIMPSQVIGKEIGVLNIYKKEVE